MKQKETSVEKLARLIKEKYDVELNPSTFKRLRPGYYQRSSGAWSWCMEFLNCPSKDFGSCESVGECIKGINRSSLFCGNEIIIENE